ncbi:MAG: Ig-like domain-containing protein, partial [Acidimicrobiia bacterium]
MLLVASLLTGSVAFHWTSVAEAAVASRPLSQAALFAGKISLSVDGIGTNDSSGGTVYVEKPEGGTVIAAYLAAASTGFTGYSPVDGDVTIDGAVVRWDADMTMANSISSVNVWADVTSIVKSDIDSAPPGQVGLRVAEPQNTQLIDGEILAVIFEDPGAVADNTVALLYGAQSVFGDTIRLSQPVLPGDSRVRLAMGLGISYGYQPAGQYSELEVNGRRLSTSAGGHDDGRPENGALLSVGGLGDSVANPADPYATDGSCTDPAPPRCDDELYDLLPFLNEGDETINLTTRNPSQDDNVFFAAFQLEGVQAVVGEGVLLTPATARSPVGDTAIYTAIVQDSQGNLTDGRTVTFTVLSGPNEGTTRTETSHGGGQATLIYSSAKEGTDRIVASIVDSTGRVRRSAEVTRVWERAGPDYVAVGDSLTTGFSIRECRDNRKVSPWGCVGSNPPAPPYPDLVAKELGYTSSDSMDLYRKYAEEPGWPPVDLARVGIWGYTIDEATTAYRTGSNVDGPWMPQLRVVDEAQKLVTVT